MLGRYAMKFIIWKWFGREVMMRIIMAAHECGMIDSRAMHYLLGATERYRGSKQSDYVLYFRHVRDMKRRETSETNKGD